MESLQEELYIKGVVGGNLKITPWGIAHLQEDSMMDKAREFLKELEEIAPGL